MLLGTRKNHPLGVSLTLMQRDFPIGISWFCGILAAIALICLFNLDQSALSRGRESSAFSVLHAQNQTVSATHSMLLDARSSETCDSGNEDGGKGGIEISCCPSASCSAAGVATAAASLSRLVSARSYREPPSEGRSPFDQTPPEEPPRAA